MVEYQQDFLLRRSIIHSRRNQNKNKQQIPQESASMTFRKYENQRITSLKIFLANNSD